MSALAKRLTEFTGERPTSSLPSEGRQILTHGSPAPANGAASGEAGPQLSRRSVVAALAAAFAPAAGTAVALPKVVETAVAAAAPTPATLVPSALAVQESPELLALGAELDTLLETYRVAAARLAEARATAAELWPEVPAEILSPSKRNDRDFPDDCYDREVDLEGREAWPEKERFPRQLLQFEPLKQYLDEVRAEPGFYEDGFAEEVTERLQEVQRYEAACAHALEASDIIAVKERATDHAHELYCLLFQIRKHVPRSLTGVLIVARALMAFEEAQKDSHQPGERASGHILGRELADAVLRLAA